MRILCVANPLPGHLDFGGRGFIKLTAELQKRNHSVHWLTMESETTKSLLSQEAVIYDPIITGLRLLPYIPVEKIQFNQSAYAHRLEQLKYFHKFLRQMRPDIIIFDRLLTFGGMVAAELGIPYVAVGTPGGAWIKYRGDLWYIGHPVKDFVELGNRIKRDLHWRRAVLTSHWVNSPYLNICFVGKSFYPFQETQGPASAYVHHFDVQTMPNSGEKLGISFGNSGNEEVLTSLIHAINEFDTDSSDPIDVFVGHKHDLRRSLETAFQGKNMRFHGWIDFKEYLPQLKYMIFFGGIGTIWHCVNHYLPMLVIPGSEGDQATNCERVSKLELGQTLRQTGESVSKLLQVINNFKDSGIYYRYRDNIVKFRSPDNYTDTLETVCGKLEALVK